MKDQTDKLYVIRAETRVLRRTVNQGRKKAMNRIRKKKIMYLIHTWRP